MSHWHERSVDAKHLETYTQPNLWGPFLNKRGRRERREEVGEGQSEGGEREKGRGGRRTE